MIILNTLILNMLVKVVRIGETWIKIAAGIVRWAIGFMLIQGRTAYKVASTPKQ